MKNSSAQTTILQPGQICAFFDKEQFYCGIIISLSEKTVQIHSENGTILNLSPARIVLLSETVYPISDSDTTLVQFNLDVIANKSDLSGEVIWHQLKDTGRELTLPEIIKLCSLDNTDACRFALFTVLRDNPCQFRHKGNLYHVLSESESQAAIQADQAHQLDLEYQQAIENWITEVISHPAKAHVLLESNNTRLEQDLSFHTHHKPLQWLHHIVNRVAPDKSYKDMLLIIRKALGQIDDSTDLFLAVSGLPVLFPRDVLNSVNETPPYEFDDSRLDITELDCWTIDAEDTEDIDDAISLQETEEGWILGIHISDVSALVAPESLIDIEAQKRTSSIYLAKNNTHMLPEPISCNIASLKVNEIRPALSLICNIDKEFAIESSELVLTQICVKRRFSYEEFEHYLDAENSGTDFQLKVLTLHNIVERHLNERILQGARIVADTGQSASRRLIAELMVLYNSKMANYAKLNKLPFFYRYLEEQLPAMDETEFADKQAFPSSILSVRPLPHQAMGLDVYAQMTSPLRRYADLVNQRQLISSLKKEHALYQTGDLETLIPLLMQTRQAIRLVTTQSEQFRQLNIVKANCENTPVEAVILRLRRNNHSLLHLPAYNCRIQTYIRGSFTKGNRISVFIRELNPETGLARVDICD